MQRFTNEEYADIHLIYGEARRNSRRARRLYQERYPNRRLPNHQTFAAVHRRIRYSGNVQRVHNEGRPGNPDLVIEDAILETVTNHPDISTRQIAANLNISHMTVSRVLRSQLLYPFHLQKVQGLTPNDFLPRQRFCHWLLNCVARNPNFVSNILFTDEANFSRDGIVNIHNRHYWADENPHAVVVRRHQRTFSINIWCGIIGDRLIGPHVFPLRLDGNAYRQFLEVTLPGLLEDLPLATRFATWFMHDGAPPHFSHAVRAHLNNNFALRWIGRGGPIAWPARSPDLNPLDYFLWGHLKSLIYRTEIADINELQERINQACEEIRNIPGIFQRVRMSMVRRAQTCVEVHGQHFEQLL